MCLGMYDVSLCVHVCMCARVMCACVHVCFVDFLSNRRNLSRGLWLPNEMVVEVTTQKVCLCMV